jgi:hypothetical protein
MNKQTALQFFLTGLVDLEIAKDLSNDDVRQMHDLYQIAKEMEKQQIIDANEDASTNELGEFLTGEQYYDEKYGNSLK